LSEYQDAYFQRMRSRLTIALLYRTLWLYPRLSRHLRGRVLDVGSGIGDMVRFRRNTVGADINPKAVEFCRSRGLDVQLMEPDRLTFPDQSFDGAILDNVLEHIEEPAPLLREIRRVLRPQATFIVGVPGRLGYASDPDHKRFYDETALKACLSGAGFAFDRMLHAPIRSAWLDKRLWIYAIYGVFRLA
jgi:SAM-dependent methyltransferase